MSVYVIEKTAPAYRHIWAQAGGGLPVAMCGAEYDGRRVAPGAGRELPVCSQCVKLMKHSNERLGGRITLRGAVRD